MVLTGDRLDRRAVGGGVIIVSGAETVVDTPPHPEPVILMPAPGRLSAVIDVSGPASALGAPTRPQSVIMAATGAAAAGGQRGRSGPYGAPGDHLPLAGLWTVA
ncbi:hypothetical protein GCM10009608_42060 [Pseudonocardia alaniniphila]